MYFVFLTDDGWCCSSFSLSKHVIAQERSSIKQRYLSQNHFTFIDVAQGKKPWICLYSLTFDDYFISKSKTLCKGFLKMDLIRNTKLFFRLKMEKSEVFLLWKKPNYSLNHRRVFVKNQIIYSGKVLNNFKHTTAFSNALNFSNYSSKLKRVSEKNLSLVS